MCLHVFLYFRQYYSFIEAYSIRYDKTLLYIFMFRCDNILILSVLRRSNQTGSPFVFTWNIYTTPDHPRRCGENMKLQRISVGLRGSPPQVRGKLCPQTSADGFSGITPAGAGKTGLRVLRPYPPTDHPRRCGENQSSQPHHTGQGGSPPQVRGKRQHPELALLFHVITPAGAGKTNIYVIQ